MLFFAYVGRKHFPGCGLLNKPTASLRNIILNLRKQQRCSHGRRRGREGQKVTKGDPAPGVLYRPVPGSVDGGHGQGDASPETQWPRSSGHSISSTSVLLWTTSELGTAFDKALPLSS